MAKRDVPGVTDYTHPAGGWDALKAVGKALAEEHVLFSGAVATLTMNQPKGFDCPGCAWPDPKKKQTFDYCENGTKAVSWEATKFRVTPEFFAEHSVSDLLKRTDYELEKEGRLTDPLVYDQAKDRYVPISWDDAFKRIGAALNKLKPEQVEFYTSGKASNEAAFLFQIFARAYGSGNFPDCSNMCHEATSVGLPMSIGVGKGTSTLDDFDHCDLILSIGHNPGTNHPRMMTTLHDCAKRGVPIVAVNPLPERSLQRFEAPQNPLEMITGGSQNIAQQFLQVKVGGDAALLKGMMKRVLQRDAADIAQGGKGVLDRDFIQTHTVGFEDLKTDLDETTWSEIEDRSGLTRSVIEQAGDAYVKAERVICCFGMGITQHINGTANVQQIVNLLMMRGNIGRQGTGVLPLRGHSNVQGNRTVGITEKPTPDLLEGIKRAFGFDAPNKQGHNAVEAAMAMIEGKSKAFISLAGNFAPAMPDPDVLYPAMKGLDLGVYLATKLNRGHLLTCKETFILPVVARSEKDEQESGAQSITVEDAASMVHASHGWRKPASDNLKSEPAIIALMAEATLGAKYGIDWRGMIADYAKVRDKIEAVFPDFKDFNKRIQTPGGFRLPVPASQRVWKTPDGKAHFLIEEGLDEDMGLGDAPLLLATLRSHDQYNTTIYGLDDRYRGVFGRRDVIFMNERDMAVRGIEHGDIVVVDAIPQKGDKTKRKRSLSGFTAIEYNIPTGCIGGYYPETNGLIALNHYDKRSGQPAYKAVPVDVRKLGAKAAPVAKTSSTAKKPPAAKKSLAKPAAKK